MTLLSFASSRYSESLQTCAVTQLSEPSFAAKFLSKGSHLYANLPLPCDCASGSPAIISPAREPDTGPSLLRVAAATPSCNPYAAALPEPPFREHK